MERSFFYRQLTGAASAERRMQRWGRAYFAFCTILLGVYFLRPICTVRAAYTCYDTTPHEKTAICPIDDRVSASDRASHSHTWHYHTVSRVRRSRPRLTFAHVWRTQAAPVGVVSIGVVRLDIQPPILGKNASICADAFAEQFANAMVLKEHLNEHLPKKQTRKHSTIYC